MDNKNSWEIIIDKLIDNINLSTETNDLIKKTKENYEKIISELNLQLQIYKIALALACNEIKFLSKQKYNLITEDFKKKREGLLKNLENNFITKAKEQLKDE